MNEVRLAVERALAKLIGRFGTQSEVIAELRRALALMDKASLSGTEAASGVESPAAVAPPAPIQQPAQAEQKAGTPGSKSKRTGVKRVNK